MSIRTPLATARGLGSAKTGTDHFWSQRVSAVALVPLSLWFIGSIIAHVGADYATVMAWLSSPFQAVLMIVFLAALYYHSQLGLRVVAEDYIHVEWVKMATIVGLQFINILLAVAAIISVLMIVLGAAG